MNELGPLPTQIHQEVFDAIVEMTRWQPEPGIIELLNRTKDERYREYLVFALNNNTSNNTIGIERPSSAFISYDPKRKRVILEWGTVNKQTGSAKLHDDLRKSIDYVDRNKQGMRILSGNIAETAGGNRVILLEALCNITEKVTKGTPEGIIVNTLYHREIAVVDAEGKFVMPVF